MSDRRDADRPPRFVTFEGVDGAGKSTHIDWFADRLAECTGVEVVTTREPGGTPIGEALREVVLHRPMHLETEALLMFAARRQLVADVIEPALARGAWVVCDRFTDATVAYQGGGRGLARDRIETLRRWVHPHLEPATTLLFDLDPEVAKRRLDTTRQKDRFENEADEFFVRVRTAYQQLATGEPARFIMIDSSQTISEIRKTLELVVASLCSRTDDC